MARLKKRLDPICIREGRACPRHKEGHYRHNKCGENYVTLVRKPMSLKQRLAIGERNKKLGIKPPSRFGVSPWNKGIPWSDTAKQKMSAIHTGRKNPWASEQMRNSRGELGHNWKGDSVGYIGLHRWVQVTLGQPDTCEHCGETGLKGHKIHWANKSRTYKRRIDDWLRLCASCHGRYDKGERTGKGKKIYVTH